MSTIRQALRKSRGGDIDFRTELAAMDGVELFPPARGRQREEFAQLANMMLEFKSPSRGASIVFASSVSGEGASFVSYQTARELAFTLDRRVFWIDANPYSPQRKLMARSQVTFQELLQDPEIAKEPAATRLQMIPAGMESDGWQGLVASDNYIRLLEILQDSYDFTFIDAPPILQHVETSLLGAGADGLVLVVERGRLKWEVIQAGLENLANRRVNVLGTVFNRRRFDLPKFLYDRI